MDETQKTVTEIPVNRRYKDRLFRMVFREKKELLSLYNALNKTNYTDAEQMEIVTLENAIYMNMKNDLAFVMDFELNLYEHQSTFSPNMPLRDLFYISKELQNLVDNDQLYRSIQVKIPTPRFLVLYNGTETQPERRELKLSDAFERLVEEPELELKVTMLNINHGKNRELLKNCKTLNDYSLFVEKVRKYGKEMPLEKAVPRAVDESIREGILKEFLRKYRNEVIEVSIFEYNEERAMKYIREDEFAQGREIGIAIGKSGDILDLLQELGTVPEDLQKRIRDEKDIDTLQRWLKSAAKASSITEFQIEMKNSSSESEPMYE